MVAGVAAVIPPCSLNGVTLTIRKFNHLFVDMHHLIETKALDETLANRLVDFVLERKNILISGGTGSGKTTLLDILAWRISHNERILLIEDTAEIRLAHPPRLRQTQPPRLRPPHRHQSPGGIATWSSFLAILRRQSISHKRTQSRRRTLNSQEVPRWEEAPNRMFHKKVK
jgi:type IV secretory pathway ATPase VirB11/archaellum biosynthesis ATPase